MVPAGDASRLGALPDWSAVPSDSEEDRALLEQRLAYFGRTMFLVSGAFLLASLALGWLLTPGRTLVFALWDVETGLHVLAASISGAQWLLCKSGRRSAAALNLIDVGGIVLAMAVYAVMANLHQPTFHEVLVLVLITILYVMARAVMVPGTARRALWIGSAAATPTLFAAWWFARTAVQDPADPWAAFKVVAYIGLWCGAAVACASFAARVIYGLQKRVREATQLGQYTLEEKIGEGGMGAVYRARHALLRRPTAVKLMSGEGAGPHDLARFEREVQRTASLAHPNTIAVYDYGHTPDGVFYYAMEYIDGITLQDLVAEDGPQPAARVIHLLRQMCGALSEAHTVGLIHRDVKPANVMTCVRGGVADHVKVLDFGLVKDADRGGPSDLSSTGQLVGTPLYLAPEAIVEPDRVDARTDLYAVGALGYFLLAGVPPFEGATLLEVCGKHLHAVPEAPSARAGIAVPASLEEVVLRCLAKDPNDRPLTALALGRELEACADVGAWTVEDATDWWAVLGPKLLARLADARRTRSAQATPPTMAVDVARRAPSRSAGPSAEVATAPSR